VTLLTVERGGRFRRSDDRLVYVPCGREPVIYAGSGRGMPYPVRADSRVPGPEPFQPRFFDAAAIARLRKVAGTGANDFMRDVWPLVTKEVCWAYYSVLYAQIYKSVGFDCFAREFAAADWDSARMHRLISLTFPDPATHWDWNRVNQPCEGRRFRGRNEYQAWVVDKLRDNLEQAALGVEESPQRAATSVLRALREQVRHAISHCGISGSSYRQHVDGWFRNLTNYLVAGPPAVRTEELIALMQAAVVRLVGPRICVVFDPSSNAFNASSEAVKDRPVTAGAMIDAHLPEPDIPRSADPLIAMMLAAGGCRPHVIADPSGDGYTVGGLDVTENEFRVVRADGTAHPRRFAYGPPLRGAQGPFGTSIKAALQHADSIARWALSEAGAGHSPRRIGFHGTGGDGVN